MSSVVAEIDVVCAGVVIVHRQLDETQSENSRIEVEGLLWVPRYRCYVVKTEDAFDHDSLSVLRDGITPYRRDEFPIGKALNTHCLKPQLATLGQN